jgi:hypothetical protein
MTWQAYPGSGPRFTSLAVLSAFSLLACASPSTNDNNTGGTTGGAHATGGTTGTGTGTGGTHTGGTTGGGTGGTTSGGTGGSYTGGTTGTTGGTTGGGTGGTTGGGTGGSHTGGTTGTTGGATGSGTGGTAAPSGSGGSVMTTGGGVASTVELIGPSAATCGATNATHGDGFICVLNYPSPGPNVVGYWFDYAFAANTCKVSFTKPNGNSASNPEVCFSGSACAATSGGGLGLALCDVHGIDVSTWPQLMMLESKSNLSSTAKSTVSGCNPGSTITSVNWTVSSGSIPAGTSVLFDDVSDVDVTRVDNLAAGATSVAVPASVDTSKVASIKFSVNGATNPSWNFCLTSLKVTLQ